MTDSQHYHLRGATIAILAEMRAWRPRSAAIAHSMSGCDNHQALEGDVVELQPRFDQERRRTITVPKGHVWVEGDNATFSVDSRHLGAVPVALLIGRPFLMDIYYRKAKEVGFRARSAFKLIQLDEQYSFLRNVHRAVDLCAAPGSWSQVLSRRLYDASNVQDGSPNVCIVAVDLQEMAPIEGVQLLQGDITSKRTADEIISYFHGAKAQVVVSDGAPDVTGVHDLDEFVQAELLTAALHITTHVLEKDGAFVAKIFRCEQYEALASQLSVFFQSVSCAKPTSSRAQSHEAFVVCQGFHLPPRYTPVMTSNLLPHYGLKEDERHDPLLVPFLASGDLSGYDATLEFY